MAYRTPECCFASCNSADTIPRHRGILQTINGGILSIELCLEFEDHLCEILDTEDSAVVALSRGRERGAEAPGKRESVSWSLQGRAAGRRSPKRLCKRGTSSVSSAHSQICFQIVPANARPSPGEKQEVSQFWERLREGVAFSMRSQTDRRHHKQRRAHPSNAHHWAWITPTTA